MAQLRPSGPIVFEKRIKLAPGANVAAKTGPDGPETTGVWAEFYAFAPPGRLAGILQ
jgi:hypothetical protein